VEKRGSGPPPGTPAAEIPAYYGVSVFSTRERAIEQARRMPRLGTHVVRLEVPDESPITWVADDGDPEHYDLHGGTKEEYAALAVGPAERIE